MKRIKRVSQRRPRPTKPEKKPRTLNRAPLNFDRAVYLTVDQLLQYAPLWPSKEAVRQWLFRNRTRVPVMKTGGGGGGKIAVRRRDFDLALEQTSEGAHA